MILLVTPSDVPRGSLYLVDVGFGMNIVARPVLLETGKLIPGSMVPEEHRLIRAAHPLSALELDDDPRSEDHKEWQLQQRCGTFQPDWRTLYHFSPQFEALGLDYEALNYAIYSRPTNTPFWPFVVYVTHFWNSEKEKDQENGALGRRYMFANVVKERRGDQDTILRVLKTEQDRVTALKEVFGVELTEQEAEAIRGRLPELARE